jgi:hypothetical protein
MHGSECLEVLNVRMIRRSKERDLHNFRVVFYEKTLKSTTWSHSMYSAKQVDVIMHIAPKLVTALSSQAYVETAERDVSRGSCDAAAVVDDATYHIPPSEVGT